MRMSQKYNIYSTKAGFKPDQQRDESGRWSSNTSYRGGHAIAPEYAVRLDDLENSESAPRGFYKDLRHYNFSGGEAGKESMRAIRYARNNPTGLINIYRGVPKGVTNINQGDWISLSKTYATEHATRRAVFSEKPWAVIEKTVKVRDVVYDHNDINEMAYFTSNKKSAVFVKAGFNPNQTRDSDGKWSTKPGFKETQRRDASGKWTDDNSNINKQLQDKYPNFKIDVYQYDKRKQFILSRIVIPEKDRNKGLGTDFMNDLINKADEMQYKIALTPSNDFGGSKERLIKFYKRFDFIKNSGENRDFSHKEDMYRNPK